LQYITTNTDKLDKLAHDKQPKTYI